MNIFHTFFMDVSFFKTIWLDEFAFTKNMVFIYLLYTCLIFSLFIVFTNFYTCIFLQPVYVSSKTNASTAILLNAWYIRICTS